LHLEVRPRVDEAFDDAAFGTALRGRRSEAVQALELADVDALARETRRA